MVFYHSSRIVTNAEGNLTAWSFNRQQHLLSFFRHCVKFAIWLERLTSTTQGSSCFCLAALGLHMFMWWVLRTQTQLPWLCSTYFTHRAISPSSAFYFLFPFSSNKLPALIFSAPRRTFSMDVMEGWIWCSHAEGTTSLVDWIKATVEYVYAEKEASPREV